jgi:betaine-aldehyde dehydrogenase
VPVSEPTSEPLEESRRRQLIEVTIDSLAELGFVGTTLAQIAGRAGVSPGLVAHYFGDKDGLLDATFRSLARRVAHHVKARLRLISTPRARIQAVIDANLALEEFSRRTGTAWLAFWGQVLHVPSLKRVQAAYQRRMLSNLRYSLKQLVPPDEARNLAAMIAAMIDGVWLRAALSDWREADSETARALLTEFVDGRLQSPPTAKSAERRSSPAAGERFASFNPATGEILGYVTVAGATEVNAAVRAAKKGQVIWAAMTGAERAKILRRAADILRSRNAELAELESRDTGKPIQETRVVDVVSGADCLEYFASLAQSLSGEHLDLGSQAFGYTRREPLGVVAGIGAWNYPLQIACWKAAPALACGNAMIFKPAELTPFTAVKLRRFFSKPACRGVFSKWCRASRRPGGCSAGIRTSAKSRSPAKSVPARP